MAKVLVDERERDLEPDVVTWGDLLERIDAEMAQAGRSVTGARFDGDDEADFRGPEAVARVLAALALVEIQGRSPEDVLNQTLDYAGTAILEFATACRGLAGDFRGRDIAQANQGLAELSQGVGALLAIIQAAADARGIDLDHLTVDDRSARGALVELGAHLEHLLGAQGARDWLTVADILEFDLEPVVRRFSRIVESLSQESAA